MPAESSETDGQTDKQGEWEGARSQGCAGSVTGMSGLNDTVCPSLVSLLSLPSMLLPVPHVLITLGLCNVQFTAGGTQRVLAQSQHSAGKLGQSSSVLPGDERRASSTIKISTSFSVVIHSAFLFPLIIEGTS